MKTKRIQLLIVLGFLLPSLGWSPRPAVKEGVHKVIIDAGHGGKDPGNLGTGRYKSREKNIALSVAKLVGQYIEENIPDVTVEFTREKDIFLELKQRTDIANKAEADLFLSIHCDAFTNPKAYGSSSIVMGKNHTDENMRIAQRENSVIFLEENYEETYEGFDPSKPETYIALTLMQNSFHKQSISFASKIQNQFKTRVKRKDRGVKQQPLYVTSRTTMPAVLVELGFLTNAKEEDFLNSQRGKELMASAIYRAFKEYKAEREYIDSLNTRTPPSGLDKKLDEVIPVADPGTIEVPTVETTPIETQPLYFTVQIGLGKKEIEPTPQNFKGLEDVDFYVENKWYKYTYGNFPTYQEANEALKRAVDAGFSDAFVVAFKNGKRINLDEAKREADKL